MARPTERLRSFFQNPSFWSARLTFGICRSTPARHAASPYQLKRHPNAQERLKHYKLLIKLQLLI